MAPSSHRAGEITTQATPRVQDTKIMMGSMLLGTVTIEMEYLETHKNAGKTFESKVTAAISNNL